MIGLALILLFGRAGMVTNFLASHVGIPRSRWIYGPWGISIAQVLAFTPVAFMILVGVLQGVSPSLEEASRTLRASPWRTFRTVTWPLMRPGLANAFLIGFVESLADFANPLVIGGNFNVLSTEIFFAVVGAAHDQGRAAVLALILLTLTLAAFAAQRSWLGRARYTTITGKGDSGIHATLPRALAVLCVAGVVPWLLLTVAVYGTILAGGFVEQIGRDNTPTWRYFLTAFGVDHGVGGWFLSGSAWPSFLTTAELSLIAMPITAALGVLTAYLLDRIRFRGRDLFEFATMMSFAIPGTVIGIGYILAFNVRTNPIDRHRRDHRRGVRVPQHAGWSSRGPGLAQSDRPQPGRGIAHAPRRTRRHTGPSDPAVAPPGDHGGDDLWFRARHDRRQRGDLPRHRWL